MKKRTSKLEGSPIDAMNRLRDDKANVRSYFYWDSLAWKAITKAIQEHKLKLEVPLNDDGEPSGLYYPRGQGCTSFKDAWVHGIQFREMGEGKKPEAFFFDFYTIEFDVYYNNLYDSMTKEYRLRVPMDLENDFTTEKFEIWLKETNEKLAADQEKSLKREMEDLLKKNPKLAKKVLKEIK